MQNIRLSFASFLYRTFRIGLRFEVFETKGNLGVGFFYRASIIKV